MNTIATVVLIPFFAQLFGGTGPFPVSKVKPGKDAVAFQNIVKFCAQRNDTGLETIDGVINYLTEKLVNTTRDLSTVQNSLHSGDKNEDENENKTRDNQEQRPNHLTTRDSGGHHQEFSGKTSPVALMNRVCPLLTTLDDAGHKSERDEIEQIVNELLLTLFWELHTLLHQNRATADGETYVDGKHYNLSELMASCCSFG